MKKVAIFTEGQTELILVRELLLRIVDASKLRLQCLELIAHAMAGAHYDYSCPDPEIYFLVVNVRGDEGVLSSIKDRERDIIEKNGFDRIIGLRDMYCEKYHKLSKGKIDNKVSESIINSCDSIIKSLRYKDRITVFFAIMEVEAWFLAMYNLFRKVDGILTAEYILDRLKIDLRVIDPQKEFYRPSDKLNDIMNLCGMEYKKKKGEVENIAVKMEVSDFKNAHENGRCERFREFYEEFKKLAEGYIYAM